MCNIQSFTFSVNWCYTYFGRMMRLVNLKVFDLFYRVFQTGPRIYEGFSELISFGQWEKWQNRVFENLTGKKILEIGVGPGKLLLRMAKKGYTVTGIELRPGMADGARRRIRKAGFDVDILDQPVYKLPFKDEIFDCIVLTFVLAEIADLDRAIVEMKRVLKNGGKIIIVAGGIPQDRNLIARFLFQAVKSHTTLRLERDNIVYLRKYGFKVTREDFGPFNIINKVVAVKPE